MKKILLISFLFSLAGKVLAVEFTNIVPDIANAQGTGGAGNFIGWIQNFYQFSLIAGVFLAVGVIVWAGLRYALAAGNPSGQSDARDQILQALLGLTLLFGAYLILFTINPNLTNLSLPTLSSVSVGAPATPPALTSATAGTDVALPPDVQAEIDPDVNIIFQRTVSGAIELTALRRECSQRGGVVASKLNTGSASFVYICEGINSGTPGTLDLGTP